MVKPTVVLTHWVHDEVLQFLEKYCHVIPNDTLDALSTAELLRRTQAADGLMVFMPDRVDETFLDHCPRLKAIGAALKGYDNIDINACRRRFIRFSFVEDLLTEPTAELAVALLLGIGRNILSGDFRVRCGQFRGWRPVLYGTGLAGSTVGIVGMGAIGRAVATRLKNFNCRLQYADPESVTHSSDTTDELLRLSLPELLAQSDFILMAVPLTSSSRHLINVTTLAGTKVGAYLINIGRGSVVDESAVATALNSGQLAGYASDVFEFEDMTLDNRPKGIHPGLLDNRAKTLFTPHLGSAVNDVRKQITLEAARSILKNLNVTIA